MFVAMLAKSRQGSTALSVQDKIGDVMPTTFINAMRVPKSDSEFFEKMWDEGADFVATQPGFVSTSLHKTTALNEEFQYYTIAVWQKSSDLVAATSSDWWKDFVNRFGFSGPTPRFTSVPALCEVARDPQSMFDGRSDGQTSSR